MERREMTPEKREYRGMDWLRGLQTDRGGIYLPLVENVRLILQNDAYLKGRVCRSEFDGRLWRRGELPWDEHTGAGSGDRLWSGQDEAGLRWYLESGWGFNVAGKRGFITDAVEMGAAPFHPVREYLEGLTWDGTPRLDTMLIRHLDAEDTPFVRTVTRKWMVAGCRRVFEPGCKFDSMLVIVSPGQGRGKSLLGDILAGPWFLDGVKHLESKDALQDLQGKWIVEMGEMAAAKKAETEVLKRFLSCRVDTFRPSYGRYAVDHPRQCVFLGSTNRREFITDETGGRRFWPVEIHGAAATTAKRMGALRRERDQLWAEAMEYHRRGEEIFLETEAEIAAAEAQQRKFSAQDEWAGLVHAYLERRLPEDWNCYTAGARRAFIQSGAEGEVKRQWVSIAEIRYELLGEELTKGGNNPTSRRLGQIMNVMEGWRLGGMRTTIFGRQKVFVRCN